MLGNHVARIKQQNKGQLFGLFDGMGSLVRGGEAARYMGDKLIDFCNSSHQPSGKALKDILIHANNDITGWPPPPGSKYTHAGGCAGTIALCGDCRVEIFHSGDTVALLLKAD